MQTIGLVVVMAAAAAGQVFAGSPRAVTCDVTQADPQVVVVDATVVTTHQVSYRCDPGKPVTAQFLDETMKLVDRVAGTGAPQRPTASTGCVLVTDSPNCANTERVVMVVGAGHVEEIEAPTIDVAIDGVARRAGFVSHSWRACDLASGSHRVELCTAAGSLTCAIAVNAGATAVLDIEAIAPTAELRITRVRAGGVHTGEAVTVGLGDEAGSGRVQLGGNGTFTWRSDDSQRHATGCAAPASAPGCTRCDGAGSPPWPLGLVLALLVRRRHRR